MSLVSLDLIEDIQQERDSRSAALGTPVATMLGTWRYGVSPGTDRPGVSILRLGEVESLICSFYFSVAARTTEQICP